MPVRLPLAVAVAASLFLGGYTAAQLAVDVTQARTADGAVTLQVDGHRAAFVFLSPGTVLLRHGDTVDWVTVDSRMESLSVVDVVGASQEAVVYVPLNPDGPAYRCLLDYSYRTPLIVESAVRFGLD
jgi:plastocyanin